MLLRARIVLPISQPPIENGAVQIIGDRILSVGPWSGLRRVDQEVADLGEVILSPGLINAHCHLDYTDMAGQIPPPKVFSDWIKSIVALKSQWGYSEFAQSWLRGARMLLRTGTTTVLDVETVPELMPDVWDATPLRVVSFRELISLKGGQAALEALRAAAKEWALLSRATTLEKKAGDRHSKTEPRSTRLVGLSPHAPYSTTPALLQQTAAEARARRWPLMTHVAESEAELDMFMHRRGPLFAWLRRQRDMSDCGLGSPVQHLERSGYLSDRLLAVHANYLSTEDIGLLAKRKVSVVHCPRSHAYFGHGPFPYRALAAAGVNVCLGTDSLATVRNRRRETPELNLFSEMQAFAGKHPELQPSDLLRMATTAGASALRKGRQLGELVPKARADLVTVPFSGRVAEAEEALINHRSSIIRVMINGQWVHRVD